MSRGNDTIYDSLSNEHRRRLLVALLEESPRTDSPSAVDPPATAVDDGETVRIEHHHIHLPKLDDYGFIEWIPDLHCVDRGPRFDEIRPILERLDGDPEQSTGCY